MIWVAIGLGVIAVVACIWFGSGPVSGNDYLPQQFGTRRALETNRGMSTFDAYHKWLGQES